MSGRDWGGGSLPCHKCGKACYQAEAVAVTIKKKDTGEKLKVVYHVKCFTCQAPRKIDGVDGICGKKLSKDKATIAEEVIYCAPCYKRLGIAKKANKVKWTPKKPSGQPKTKSKFGGGGTKCAKIGCGKTVYQGERLTYEKKIYHKDCFYCDAVVEKGDPTADPPVPDKLCKKKFTPSTIGGMYEDHMYCKQCWKAKGFNKKQTKVVWHKKEHKGEKSSKYGGNSQKCDKCGEGVFIAEMIKHSGCIFHKKCFHCNFCNTDLAKKTSDANIWIEKDEDGKRKEGVKPLVICKKCFKTEGYARKQAQVKVHKHKTKDNPLAGRFGGGGKKCPKCGKAVYSAEAVLFEKITYHANCFVCEYNDTCGKMTTSDAVLYEGKLYCRKHFREGGFAAEQRKVKQTKHETKKVDKRFQKFGGGGQKCYVCGKSVFSAEQISFEKHAFHPKCFCCKNCGTKMKNTGAEKHLPDGPDGHMDIYCKKCFKTLGLNRAKVVHHDTKDESKDDAPKDDAPKDDAPVDDAPKDDAPVDDAPKDDAPVDDAPKDDDPAPTDQTEDTQEPEREELD